MSREPNLAEILKSQYQRKASTISEKQTNRLGAYSGIERREPEAKSRRNLEILITVYEGLKEIKKRKRLGAYSRADRHEPGAKSCRNHEIEIPA